jgi:CDP-diacylglycerol--glycerol-3-phosphate 3-phosphatidyltransferase
MMQYKMTLANRLTILRIMLIPFFVICVIKMDDIGYTWMIYCAFGVFVLMALTDALDGIFARRRHEVTELGKHLDPLADKLMMSTAVIMLSTNLWPEWSRLLWFTPVIVISRDLFLLLGSLIIILVNGKLKFHSNITGKATTAVQVTLILYVLFCQSLYTALPGPPPNWMRPVMWGLQWVVIGCTFVSWMSYTYVGSRQLHEHDVARAGEHPARPKGPDNA